MESQSVLDSHGAAGLEPHAPLPAYYPPGQKSGFLRGIFDRTAGDYDRIERLMALGTGAWYRRAALRRAGLAAGMKVLDVAAGTGAVAREALGIVGPGGSVVALDPSAGMLGRLVERVAIRVVRATGEHLPLADGQFDFLSVGYALRHLADLAQALREFHRVLRPGGVVCLLEITAPQRPLPRMLARAYFRGLVPCITRLAARHADSQLLWRYYWDTIDACVPPGRVLEAMTAAGFERANRHSEMGIFSEFTGVKR
ncbi:MAG TPA: class I SAM-dependent methyltransferase [Tepidisphaeraceae bacterium]|nr:class I SAM-dependent methyltransferase [Tepidisphaeraceae bacterium]